MAAAEAAADANTGRDDCHGVGDPATVHKDFATNATEALGDNDLEIARAQTNENWMMPNHDTDDLCLVRLLVVAAADCDVACDPDNCAERDDPWTRHRHACID